MQDPSSKPPMDRKGKGKMDPADAVEYPSFPSFDLGISSTPISVQKQVDDDGAGVAEQTEGHDKGGLITKEKHDQVHELAFISHYIIRVP